MINATVGDAVEWSSIIASHTITKCLLFPQTLIDSYHDWASIVYFSSQTQQYTKYQLPFSNTAINLNRIFERPV